MTILRVVLWWVCDNCVVPITRLTRLELNVCPQMDLQVLPEVGLVDKLLAAHDTFDGGCSGSRWSLALVIIVYNSVHTPARIIIVVTTRGFNFHHGFWRTQI